MAFKNDIEKGIVVEVKAVSNDSVVSLNDATVTAPAPAPAPAPADEQPLVRQDGGLTAWAQVAAGFLLSCVAWGYPAMFGVYQSYYTKTLLLPAVQVSWIGSIQTFLTYLISTASGRLSDAGYAKIVILVGSTIVVLGTILTSLATEYWQILLAQGIFTGCGLGLLTAPTVAIIPHYFDKKRAFALSLASAGTSAGGAFSPAVVQYLLPHIGFAWAVRCSALLAAVLCVNAYFLLRPRPVVKTTEKKALVDLAAFKEIPYSLFVLSSFLLFWVLYFGFFYINVYAEQTLNFSASSAASLLIIATATGIPGRLLIGIVADRWTGAMNTFILSVAALGLVHFAWAGVTSAGGMYAFVTAFGLANGAAQGVWIGALTTVASDPAKMGERFGMVCTVTAFATLAGPPTAGAVVDKAGWLGGQMWAGVVILLASLAVVIGRSKMVGWKFAVKV